MKKLYLRLLLVVALVVPAGTVFAQDAAFSQYYNTPFLTNPAMLSFRPDMVVGANFRSQWSGLGVPYTSFLLSGYYPILSKNKLQQFGSAGGYVLNDRQPGKLNTLGFGVAGAYKLPVNYANYFHFGITVGYLGRSINNDGTTGNQVNPNSNYFDPSRPTGENLNQSRAGATIGLGTSWVNEDVDGDLRAQLGVAAYHVNAPNISFQNSIDNLYRKFVFTGSVRALKAPGFSIYPGARFIYQGPAHKLNIGALARFAVGGKQNPYGGGGGNNGGFVQPGNIGFGLYYQTNDASALIGMVEIVQPRYAISFNYDFGMGSLKDGTTRGNASEFFVAYRKTLGKRRKVDLRYFNTEKNSDASGAPASGGDIPDGPAKTPAPAPTPAPTPTPAAPAPAPVAPAPAPKTAVEAATKLNTGYQTKKTETAASTGKARKGKGSKSSKSKKGKAKSKAKTSKKKAAKKRK